VNKYGAKRTDGYASKREATRAAELRLLERAGQISELREQVSIMLQGENGPLTGSSGRALTYRADFVYRENGREIVEDCKGFQTPAYKLKRAILKAQGVEVRET
jgi:hypothetical protein